MKHFSTLSLIAALALVASTAAAQSPFYQTNLGRQHDNAVTASAETRASNTVELSYLDVTQQMWNDMGISVNGKWRMGVAVVFPQSMVSKYVGSKVTHISFGWNTTKISPVAEFFVRTSLDGEDVASATAALKNKSADANNYYGSWNKIALDDPYVIEADKDLVIGYFADMEPVGAGVSCIPFSSYGISSPEHCQYIMNCSLPEEEGGNMWIELINEQTGKPTSPLFASATIVDDSGTMINLCEVMEAYCLPVITKEVATGGLLRIVNRGTNDITSLELTYTFGGAHRSETVNLSKGLTPAKQSNVSMPFYALGSGKHTVAVTKVNGKTNKIAVPVDYQTIGV
ncbi:MAG: hypothetical protein HUK02_09565, partial [Bacteroidaceae bacterium]|nr:hypothetical protein [Bacteroidaceae bacterium]